MGCCTSSLVDQDLPTPANRSIEDPPASHRITRVFSFSFPETYYSNSKPFKRFGLMWTAEKPITKSELEKQRLDFWETAPSYGGRLEIWQALQVAFSESDIILARSILEAANIILPTGNPCDGCFDELGYEYDIPVYCIVPPVNLLYENNNNNSDEEEDDDMSFIPVLSCSHLIDKNETSSPLEHVNTYLVPAPDSSKNPFPITVRLSTEKDLNIDISADQETVGSLKTRLFDTLPNTNENSFIRMVYLGRILRDNLRFICDHEDIDLESTFLKKGHVRITNKSIIQALIFKRS